ncbi:hypothetical protein [Nocardioides sp. GXQ0305]|uniref:hypothetical protein n=1 Tax=Nocardioides sp. GXQ0305 TaxID=3423912 RepID=UPI003D7DCF03
MNVVHPVVAATTTIDGALKDVADVDPVFMDVADQRTVLLELTRLEARLAELRLRVMAASGQVAADEGARDVAAWLAHRARLDRGECRRDLGLATRLERHRPVLAEALRAGEVNRA